MVSDERLAAWLAEVQARGVKMGLERVRAALHALGQPQRSAPAMAVAGTNGKGSTVAFASALLAAAGHRVGSTISPHLVAYRERFRIDGVPVQEAQLVAALEEAAQLRGAAGFEELTFFELGLCLASLVFREAGVDAAVYEVGMGGEFDATRAAEPVVCGLVTVDRDHEAFLGSQLEAIARTKARIASPDALLVCTETRAERLPAIEQESGERLVLAGRDFRWSDEDGLTFEGPGLRLDGVELGLRGRHQAQNAACALAMVLAFCERTGLKSPSPWQARNALRDVRWPGRLERLRSGPGGPAFLLDGAHNAAAAQVLADELAQRKRPAQRVWLFAAMADKDVEAIAGPLRPHVDRILCCKGRSSPRFAEPDALAEAVGGEPVGDAAEAAVELVRQLGSRDEVLVAGSLYLVGDVRAALGKPVA